VLKVLFETIDSGAIKWKLKPPLGMGIVVCPGFGISIGHRDPGDNSWNQSPPGHQTSRM